MKIQKKWSWMLLAVVALMTLAASCSKNKEYELDLDGVPADDGTQAALYSRYYGWWMYGSYNKDKDGKIDWSDEAWGYKLDAGNKGEAYTGNSHWTVNWYPKGNLIVTQSPQTGNTVTLEVIELGSDRMKVRFVDDGSGAQIYTLIKVSE